MYIFYWLSLRYLLIYARAVKGDEDALMITSTGKVIRFSLSSVSQIHRSTSGVKLMNVDENERIQSITMFTVDNSANDIADAPIDNDLIENEDQLKQQDK